MPKRIDEMSCNFPTKERHLEVQFDIRAIILLVRMVQSLADCLDNVSGTPK